MYINVKKKFKHDGERQEYCDTKKEENMSENKKKNKGQLFVKVMAAVLAGLMVLATCGTVIFYLVSR